MGLLSTVRNVAGGRLPPATRFAVLCGFGIFVVGLLVQGEDQAGRAAALPLGQRQHQRQGMGGQPLGAALTFAAHPVGHGRRQQLRQQHQRPQQMRLIPDF